MNRPIIEVRNLSKAYRLGAIGASSLKDELARLWERARRQSLSSNGNGSGREFWALKDVSFDVAPGEVLGIIGRNGAGKSTLLRILSRITQQTSGTITLRGRVASLLEVGTGFHPDLTGRENTFLNGAILGMSKVEIRRKFDEIVAFAEIEQFIDTPVKRYSSGMYVRLAFAVAAHLEPEILVVDEVLAVGDAAFQKKCLGKMGDVANQYGRTVLFVSHNMAAIRALCTRSVLMDHGKVACIGATPAVLDQYVSSSSELATMRLSDRTDRKGDGRARLCHIRVEACDGSAIRPGSNLRVTLAYESKGPLRRPTFLIGVYDARDVGLFALHSGTAQLPPELPPRGSIVVTTAPINLTSGRCYVNVGLTVEGTMVDYVQCAAAFDIVGSQDNALERHVDRDWAVCLLPHSWEPGPPTAPWQQ